MCLVHGWSLREFAHLLWHARRTTDKPDKDIKKEKLTPSERSSSALGHTEPSVVENSADKTGRVSDTGEPSAATVHRARRFNSLYRVYTPFWNECQAQSIHHRLEGDTSGQSTIGAVPSSSPRG